MYFGKKREKARVGNKEYLYKKKSSNLRRKMVQQNIPRL